MLLFVSVLFASVGALLQRVLMKGEDSDPWAYSVVFQILVGVMTALYGYLFADMTLPRNITPLILNLILMTLLWSASNVFLYSALKRIEASIFTVIFSSRSLFTTLTSSIFLQEILTGWQLIGALFIILGALFVTFKKKGVLKFDKGVFFALLAAASFGFANTNDRSLLGSFNLYPYVTIAFIVPALFMVLIKPSSVRKMRDFTNMKLLRKMILLCVVYALASITFFGALQIAPNSSQVASISVFSVVLTVIFSIIFLKEKENIGRKVLGAVAAFIGLLLVS